MTIAERVSQEVGCDLGSTVGYNVRFDDKTTPETRVKYLTDGMLLREIQMDARLSKYSVILLDEAHERTLNTDILFGLLKRLQATTRPDLRVIAMSATLDAGKFSKYFYDAPIAIVPGRTHKVDIFHVDESQTDVCEAAVVTVMQLHQDKPLDGDVLVFLSGSDEIESVIEALNDRNALLPAGHPQLACYPMYSTLNPDQQLRAFEPTPPGCRKVVVATNIAETSITLSGIKYVVDSGLAKVKTFQPSTGLEMLEPLPISQAECFQRSGRSGREREGECYRLYTEEDFGTLSTSVEPEIKRCNLTAAVLQLKAVGVQDVLAFDFIDAPNPAALECALKDLKFLQALDADGDITPLGRMMNNFPIEPRYARVLIASAKPETAVRDRVRLLNAKAVPDAPAVATPATDAEDDVLADLDFSGLTPAQRKQQKRRREHVAEAAKRPRLFTEEQAAQEAPIPPPFGPCSDEMCSLVAALSVENLLVTVPRSNRQMSAKCAAARRKFLTPSGDMLMYVEMMQHFAKVKPHEQRKWATDNFVNLRNMTVALNIRNQLIDIMEQNELPVVSCVAERMRQDMAAQGLTGDSSSDARMLKSALALGDGGVDGSSTEKLYEDLKKCLITGLYDHVAIRQYDGKYMSEGKQVLLHPTSIASDYVRQADMARRQALAGGGVSKTHAGAQSRTVQLNKQLLGKDEKEEQPFKVFVYHSLVYTSRNYIRDVMTVSEDWLHQVHPEYFKTRKDVAGPRDDDDMLRGRGESHNKTLFKGQRTAFSSLTSNKLSATVDTGAGRALIAKTTAQPTARSVLVSRDAPKSATRKLVVLADDSPRGKKKKSNKNKGFTMYK
jgi:HrpA-like RNA helicase